VPSLARCSHISTLALILLATPVLAQEDCSRSGRLLEEAKPYLTSNAALAESKLREAVASCAASAALHYDLALALIEGKKSREAETELEAAMNIRPRYANAANALAASIYSRKDGDYNVALKFAKLAVNLEPQNKSYQQTLETLLSSVDQPPSTKISNPDAVAVVIGNRSYADPGIPAVEYADHDAAIIRKYLVDALGFKEDNIIFAVDARYLDFKKIFGDANDHHGTLYNWSKQGRSDIFIYYSGHGVPDTDTRKAYLAPVDLDPRSARMTGYSLDVLYDNLAKLAREKNPKSISIVLDACFSGASNNGLLIKDASPIFVEVLNPVLAMQNAVVVSSSQGNQLSSWYPEQKHGLFTYFLLKNVKNAAVSGTQLNIGDLEKALLSSDGVNAQALKLYNREQAPQVVGNKEIVLVR
jgi:tetratricopeptide (TPR) repeat protein